ncbi:MAG: hypothetical protein IJ661_13460 [Lachnospiraceae bacterium]|nr:hypothetical protein [Lachnospiraceae bacterium]
MHVYIEDEEIVTTDGHPFYVEGTGFIPSEELKPGDLVRLADGRTVPVISIEIEYVDEPVLVYNFEVENSHTYYVSELGVLVHNTGCPKDTPAEVETIAMPSKVSGSGKVDFYVGSKGAATSLEAYDAFSISINNLQPDKGYALFDDLKIAIGSAGKNRDWHHIVEQSQIKKSGFTPELIHNTNNIISIDRATHRKISGYYSTKSFDFTNGLSVRDWLAGQSYEEQYKFGIEVLRKFGVIK